MVALEWKPVLRRTILVCTRIWSSYWISHPYTTYRTVMLLFSTILGRTVISLYLFFVRGSCFVCDGFPFVSFRPCVALVAPDHWCSAHILWLISEYSLNSSCVWKPLSAVSFIYSKNIPLAQLVLKVKVSCRSGGWRFLMVTSRPVV